MSEERRRKTLPFMKTDQEIEDEHYGDEQPLSFQPIHYSHYQHSHNKHKDTLLHSPEAIEKPDMFLQDRPPPIVEENNNHETAKAMAARFHSFAHLKEDSDMSKFHRHSVGFDVPGAVHTIAPSSVKTDRPLDSKLAVIMVGLPARGKSYIVKKLRRYLNWLQYETRVFNVGNLRRVNEASQHHDQSANFFDPDNNDMKQIRDILAIQVLEQMIDWLKEGGRVGIHDATNSTIARRKLLIDRLSQEPEIKVLILESVCTDKMVLERNFRLKLSGPDYKDHDPAEALADFRSRVANYERAHETVGDWEEQQDIQYCKLINVGKKVIAHHISGYLSGQCIFYLMNFNLAERQIFITRHGESMDNIAGRIGGDAPLSEKGRKYAIALEKFVKEQRTAFAYDLSRRKVEEEQAWRSYGLEPLNKKERENEEENATIQERIEAKAAELASEQFTIWTSMLQRSMDTASNFDPEEYDIKHIRFLNEINSGAREGMTYEEIQRYYPEEFKTRQRNKLYYRYPGMGGESYIDVIHRLQPMIIELERMVQSCLIVTHRVVMRIILGYMLDWSQKEMPHMIVPIHTVYELRPKPYGTELKKWRYVEEKDAFEEF
ncbi:6-phosphofructo-2-kinase-domain-containing protein [Spinellus fusiger]|nr:6-phosphofructo-2-kinase-domain-containing protein [Spinellus fusiger]